jgi:hypothetical protein
MNQEPNKSHLCKGVMQFARGGESFEIAYSENESRSGRLWVDVYGMPLDHMELLVLAQRIQQKEKTLADGRARYKEMAMQFAFLQHSEPGP